jgi:hypothetical protein
MLGGHLDLVRHFGFLLQFIFNDLNYQNISLDLL